MDGRYRRRRAASIAVIAGVLSLAACTSADAGVPADPQPSAAFRLDFDGADPFGADPDGAFTVSERSRAGGTATLVASHAGGSHALAFPAFTAGADIPGFGLVVTAGASPLPNPGRAAFAYGADVRMDAVGEAVTSEDDNGENVFQRGLASDDAEFKLQADAGIPECTVKGAEGQLTVRGRTLSSGVWYRLRCARTPDRLTLTVTEITTDAAREFSVDGASGAIDFAPSVPMGIGHKLAKNGQLIVRSPDQFNGTLDDVWIAVDPG